MIDQETRAQIIELAKSVNVSAETIDNLLTKYDPIEIAKHLRYTHFLQHVKHKLGNPPGWFIASLRGNFNAPVDFPVEDLTKLVFVLDDAHFAEVVKARETK
jgi:hypothetical protein